MPDCFLAISPTTKHEKKHDSLKEYAAQVQVNKATNAQINQSRQAWIKWRCRLYIENKSAIYKWFKSN